MSPDPKDEPGPGGTGRAGGQPSPTAAAARPEPAPDLDPEIPDEGTAPPNAHDGESADTGGADAAETGTGETNLGETGTGETASGHAATAPRKPGHEVIADCLKTLPNSPGVYRMYGADGTCLYVGKARSLKKRVTSYTRIAGHSNRIARMIQATATMEFVTTRTESEALLLEANLITRLKPRFNVLLRDDKSFPYILVSRDHRAPQILKHRGARNRRGDYFGPFASAGAVTRTINTLQRAFLLRTCSDAVFESRTRPCLLHQIKRCAAPCTGEIDPADYDALVDEAVRFLKGEGQHVREQLRALMMAASDRLEFEQAARYRNRLAAISHVQAHQGINPEGVEEADVFAAYQEGGQTCIEVFFFRTGQNWGNRAYFPRADRALGAAEVLDALIAQFYDDKPVPRLILVSHELPDMALLAEALSTKAERRVEIALPQRGAKRDLVDHALANAREALGRRMAESSSQRTLIAAVARTFGLERPPRRIEVYDNSHIQGASAVGAMIVAGPEGFAKGQYRKFNIRSSDITPGDDFAMMREVLTRRFARLLKEHGEGAPAQSDTPPALETHAEPSPSERPPSPRSSTGPAPLPAPPSDGRPVASGAGEGAEVGGTATEDPATEDPATEDPVGDDRAEDVAGLPAWPDLVLIDGGKGQLAAARAVLADLGLSGLAMVGIAKGPDRDAGREHFHMAGRDVFMLEPRDPVLYFVQRLRDEAHRFAIGSHRQKRKKALGVNPLDEIAGIGPTRKRALLAHFGSAKAVSRAGVTDLTAVEGISEAMARAIYDHFHEGEG
ncbi:MAG: excinuclease ABC subunit UvrC [Hyphomicrobiaceae bacterium]